MALSVVTLHFWQILILYMKPAPCICMLKSFTVWLNIAYFPLSGSCYTTSPSNCLLLVEPLCAIWANYLLTVSNCAKLSNSWVLLLLYLTPNGKKAAFKLPKKRPAKHRKSKRMMLRMRGKGAHTVHLLTWFTLSNIKRLIHKIYCALIYKLSQPHILKQSTRKLQSLWTLTPHSKPT